MTMIPHSCEAMSAALDDPSVLIRYVPRVREFSIPTMRRGRVLPANWLKANLKGWVSNIINYCPWCGDLLPGSVRDQYFDTICEDLGVEDYDVLSPDDGLPEEMLTDAWWRRRKIGPTADLHAIGEYTKLREGDRYEYHGPHANALPGYAVPSEEPPHLCRSLLQRVRRDDDMITYIPETREFGIRMIDPVRPVDHQPIRVRAVRFCPWCGVELPSSLRAEWLEQLKTAGHSPEDPHLPASLNSGQWWRDLGL